jgi:hypothetical protein
LVQQVRRVIREQQGHKVQQGPQAQRVQSVRKDQQEPVCFQELVSHCLPPHLRQPDLLYWEQPQ